MRRYFSALIGLVFSLSLVLSPIVFAAPDTWTKKADMPTGRGSLSASAVNGKIYAIGGWNNTGVLSTIEEYDPVSDKWTKKADMPTGRAGLSTSVVNGKIYAIGGLKDNTGVLSTIEEYDPVSDTCTKKRDMPTGRWYLSASAVNGKIYAIGGSNDPVNKNGFLSTVEEYDPVLDTWTKKRDMPTARYGLSTSVVNGRIYAIGGGGNDIINNGFISTVEEYDPVSDKWTKKAKIPTARNNLSTSIVNGKIYAIGGNIWDGVNLTIVTTAEEYDPAADKWTKKSDMPTARYGLSTSVVNGKIYAIAGQDASVVLSTVEEYDTGFTGVEAKGKLADTWGGLKKR